MTTARARTVAQLDRHGTPSHEVYTAGFYGSDRDFVVRSLLGPASRGGADAGEVLATIAGAGPDDQAGWVTGWTELGTRLAATAATCARHGHRVSATRAYLRAAEYLAVAVSALGSSALGSNVLGSRAQGLLPTFHAHRAAWEGFVATTRWPVERVDVPYEGESMPGWLFRPDVSGAARPTLVIDNGIDGPLSRGWCMGAEGALERGYTVLLFDGPGQQSMLFERDVPSRDDWEKVLTPVVDFLVARDDVDAGGLAVYGIGRAGCRVPRALAFEHRFAAAVVDGGAVDVDDSRSARTPPGLLDVHVAQHRLHDVAGRITTPLFITDPDGEQFFPGQAAELAELVPAATLARFTQEEGASHRCQPLARELTEQRIFDWLDEQLKWRPS